MGGMVLNDQMVEPVVVVPSIADNPAGTVTV
jgi:hypothetical protein